MFTIVCIRDLFCRKASLENLKQISLLSLGNLSVSLCSGHWLLKSYFEVFIGIYNPRRAPRVTSLYVKLLLLLSHFSRVQLCATPETAAHQAPPSPEFSRQEHWSGLPFPSLVHESEKWKWSRSVMSDPERPHGLQPTRLLHPWDFPGKSSGVACHCLLQYVKLKEIKGLWPG